MSDTKKDNTFKKFKAITIALFQTISEFISIIAYFAFIVLFIIQFSYAVLSFFQNGFNSELLIKKCLTSFELLFIAPIPILIIFAFRAIMTKMFPIYFNKTEDAGVKLLTLDLAKKTFISSIIGVLATYILGVFLSDEAFEIGKTILFLAFLITLIVYYKFLADHTNE